VGTFSYEMKKSIHTSLLECSDSLDGIDFQLHDFGFRGVSSVESAGIGGAAHLVNFKGTDTLQALVVARKYYGSEIAGFSVPASEHSTVTVWQKSGEKDAYKNMLDQFPNGIVSVVSDSYDIYNACSKIWGEELKDLVEERGKAGNALTIRPDSGDPATVVCKLLNILSHKFGATQNSKGYKVLPPYLRLLQVIKSFS
jgi:nicotinamide phosphoribosyltransferase